MPRPVDRTTLADAAARTTSRASTSSTATTRSSTAATGALSFPPRLHRAPERRLGLRIKPTEFKGDIHSPPEEREWFAEVEEAPWRGARRSGSSPRAASATTPSSGGTPARYQQVVDHFRGPHRLRAGGRGAITTTRRSTGSSTCAGRRPSPARPADVPRPGRDLGREPADAPGGRGRGETRMPKNRPCVVIAGGREPPHFTAYPHHQFIHTVGRCAAATTAAAGSRARSRSATATRRMRRTSSAWTSWASSALHGHDHGRRGDPPYRALLPGWRALLPAAPEPRLAFSRPALIARGGRGPRTLRSGTGASVNTCVWVICITPGQRSESHTRNSIGDMEATVADDDVHDDDSALTERREFLVLLSGGAALVGVGMLAGCGGDSPAAATSSSSSPIPSTSSSSSSSSSSTSSSSSSSSGSSGSSSSSGGGGGSSSSSSSSSLR